MATWKQLADKDTASDIDVGSDGVMWIIGTQNLGAGGKEILRWDGSTFAKVTGQGEQIAVGSAEHVAVVNAEGKVYVRAGGSWQQRGGEGIAMDVGIGLLTANLVTIVFVLTLSHVVFLTANWRGTDAGGESATDRLAQTLRLTWEGSLWSMVTTLLGFAIYRAA